MGKGGKIDVADAEGLDNCQCMANNRVRGKTKQQKTSSPGRAGEVVVTSDS